MAAEMDEKIRAATSGERSLKDALRYLVDWSVIEKRAFTLEELPRLLSEGAGVDVRPIFERWLRPQPR